MKNINILEKFLKRLGFKNIAEKDNFKILRWPFVTFNDLWGHASYNKNIAPSLC